MSEMMTIARPYAKAVFDSALAKNTLPAWSKSLKQLGVIAGNSEMKRLLQNPLVTKKTLVDLFIDLAGPELSQDAKNLIDLLAERKRLNLLPEISKVFEKCLADHERMIEVKVVSAYPIDETRMRKLQGALQTYLKRQVTLQQSLDSALVGGAIIYAGDLVIDGSLRGKLNRLSERLCH